jgi:hypothetical protein
MNARGPFEVKLTTQPLSYDAGDSGKHAYDFEYTLP